MFRRKIDRIGVSENLHRASKPKRYNYQQSIEQNETEKLITLNMKKSTIANDSKVTFPEAKTEK